MILSRYHQRHLAIARQLGDRVGEARASWSLGNAHSALGAGHEEKALYYAGLHLDLSREVCCIHFYLFTFNMIFLYTYMIMNK